jgi:adenylate cyclase
LRFLPSWVLDSLWQWDEFPYLYEFLRFTPFTGIQQLSLKKAQQDGMAVFSMKIVLKWIYNRFVPTLLALLALAGLWFLGQQLEPQVLSLFMRWSAKPASNSLVTLILIDDESIMQLQRRFGSFPWPRKRYLEIFKRINASHPSVMVFDSYFVNMGQDNDTHFFTELKRFPNLISGLAIEEPAAHQSWLNTHLPQYYHLNLGVVSMNEDPDGVVRSLKPIYQLKTGNSQTGVFPALSLAGVFEKLTQSSPLSSWEMNLEPDGKESILRVYPEQRPTEGLSVHLAENGEFTMRWAKVLNAGRPEYARSHEAISLWRFFNETSPAPDLSNRIALIGSSSTLYRDYHQTPVANRHLGPDIHATAIDNIMQGQAVRKSEAWVNLLITLFLCQLIFVLRLKLRGLGKTLLYTLGTMIIYCWVAFYFLDKSSLWLDVITPEIFIVAAFLAGSTFRIIFKEKQLAVMEKNLSQLVDPEVFQEIRRLSHILKPGGQKLEITSMFVDIRNFTSLAEHLQPHEVTELLNEFYSDIVNIVFSYHGTIDKFMGDGILIIFGAPLPSEQHRAMALRAANDILESTRRLSQRWQETLGINTDIGISLNSGLAFVGFLGPADKLEYTGVGDTVNICVRLQEHTKQFRTRLIMSEHTVKDLPEQLAQVIPVEHYVELGEVAVRGREATICVFTLSSAFLD